MSLKTSKITSRPKAIELINPRSGHRNLTTPYRLPYAFTSFQSQIFYTWMWKKDSASTSKIVEELVTHRFFCAWLYRLYNEDESILLQSFPLTIF